MFVRGVEVIGKPSKTLEVADTIRERALPILRKQSGFVDEIVLVSDTEDHVLALSFWNTKEDAERYHGDEYPTLWCDPRATPGGIQRSEFTGYRLRPATVRFRDGVISKDYR